jgi:hypothetical protein|tara:strand:- start:2027 stop:2464 length:438 start_codon:yes stop_codon:yes gene_type:complete
MTKFQIDTNQNENQLSKPKKLVKKFGYFSVLQGQLMDLPISDVYKPKRDTYTKEEVDELIKYAIGEARKIDEASMAKHNRDATVLSMILGFTTLALFVDGLLRLLGIIPPFMQIDIGLLDRIVDRVENDVIDRVRQVPIQKLFNR